MKLGPVKEPPIGFDPRHYLCKRAKEKPAIDGDLSKAFWKDAPWSEDFTDIEGERRPVPPKKTRMKMLWDDWCLYIGAEMEEDRIWATLTERDSVIFNDNDFEIFIDPDGDTHNYYEFEMNALNTIWDLFLTKPYRDNGKPVNNWDIRGIETAVHIRGEINNPRAQNAGWSLEVAMPWSVLKECASGGRAPETGEYWRINFSRVEWQTEVVDGSYAKCIDPATGKPYPEDNWVWSPTGVVNMHYPELWGFVVFAGEAAEFAIPQDEKIKWELRKLYYRQRNYYAENGRFCDRFEEIKGNDRWTVCPKIEITSSLFQISAPSEDGRGRLNIREDGKTWREG